MSDLAWFIIIGVVFILTGMAFVILGLKIMRKQRTDLIIAYHCDKVSEENKKAYCRLFGLGLLLMGIGFLASGICSPLIMSVMSLVPMAVGLALGIALIISSVLKYNR